jgi:hypothetical protein
MLICLITYLETFMNNKIFSYDIFFSGKKKLYPLFSTSYANYVQQYLQKICIKIFGKRKMYVVLIHLRIFIKKNIWTLLVEKYMINYPCILDMMSEQIPLSLTQFRNSINEYSYILDLISKLYR